MIDKKLQQGGTTPLPFVDILQEMNSEGGFTRSVLATSEGLPIASDPENQDNEVASAMVALLQQVGNETQDNLHLAPVDEVTIRTENQNLLVCRKIISGNEWLTLCALVPPDQAYRRATNRAVRRIREILDS